MLKKDFVNLYAKKYKVTPEKSLEVIDNVLDLLKDVFSQEELLKINNFGVFEIRETKERKVVDPKDGTNIIHAKPRKYIKFKISKNLQDSLCLEEE